MTKKKINSLGSSSIISLVFCFICGINIFSHVGTQKIGFIIAFIGFFIMAIGFYFDNRKSR